MKHHLSVSFVIATYNSSRTIERCLKSIRTQKYPQKLIEIIIADGGSTDGTLVIAKKYEAIVVHVDKDKQNAEYNKSIGIQHASKDILAMVDHDNILPHNNWLTHMIEPFIDDPNIVGAETLRYHYDPNTSLLDRYFALFGAADPLVWYMGKADRLSYIHDTYVLAGTSTDRGNYYTIQFDKDNIPTIGANGFLVRKAILMKYADARPGKYYDMDVNVDLITRGFTTYAFVKDSILHLTGYGDIWYFLQRRLLFLTQYRFSEKGEQVKKNRRYGALKGADMWKLIFSIFLCLTVIVPFIDSLRGWRKIHDSAWFLHTIFAVSFVVIYSWAIMKRQLDTYGKKILEK